MARHILLLPALLAAGVLLLLQLSAAAGSTAKPDSVCEVNLQGTVHATTKQFAIDNADIKCSGKVVKVVGHPALAQYKSKFRGVDYEERQNVAAIVRFAGDGTLLVRNSTFTSMTVDEGIYILEFRGSGVDATVTHTTMYSNSGSYLAPLRVNRGAKLTLSETVISYNTPLLAGAAVVEAGSTLVITNWTSLSDNGNKTKSNKTTVLPLAGALVVDGKSSVTLDQSTVAANDGLLTGGLLLAGNSSVAVTDSQLSNNTAHGMPRRVPEELSGHEALVEAARNASGTAVAGGAVVLSGTLQLSQSAMIENSADGGAGAAAFGAGGSALFEKSSVVRNAGEREGGALHVAQRAAAKVLVAGTGFDGNRDYDVVCVGGDEAWPMGGGRSGRAPSQDGALDCGSGRR